MFRNIFTGGPEAKEIKELVVRVIVNGLDHTYVTPVSDDDLKSRFDEIFDEARRAVKRMFENFNWETKNHDCTKTK